MRGQLSPRRFWIVVGVIFVLFTVVSYQVFQLTYFHRDSLLKLATRQHRLILDITPLRGVITDRNGREFVTNLKVPSVYAVPRILTDDEKTELAKKVSKILNLDPDWTRKRLSKNKAFVWLKRRTAFEEAEKIKNLKNRALGLREEYKRFYPQGDILSHVLGFTNIDNDGLEGIELYMNSDLKGRPGKRITKRDAMGREIKALEIKTLPAIDGNRIVLTIDQHLQYLLEKALDKAYKKWNAKAAWAILMDPNTGEILAIANRPTYDPNLYRKSLVKNRRNRVITDLYEPGSVFKIIAASAVLNEGIVTPETKIDCEEGELRYSSKILHDVHPYGMLSMTDVIVKSSNIGTVKLGLKLDPDVFYKYVKDFGFNKKAGIDFPGEAGGFIRSPSKWSKTSPYNIPIGHEVLVTALQMTRAMAVIANGGKLVTPYLVSKIEDQAGIVLKSKQPARKKIVISPETAEIMRNILVQVVERGTGKRAKIDDVFVGGKTGTAQKVLPDGKGYSHDKFMSSFVGFAPLENPKYVMTVVLDEAHPKYYGGTVAAPVFQEVLSAALLLDE